MISVRKSVRVGKGARMNISKRGISMSKRVGPFTFSTGKSGWIVLGLFWLMFWPFALVIAIVKAVRARSQV